MERFCSLVSLRRGKQPVGPFIEAKKGVWCLVQEKGVQMGAKISASNPHLVTSVNGLLYRSP